MRSQKNGILIEIAHYYIAILGNGEILIIGIGIANYSPEHILELLPEEYWIAIWIATFRYITISYWVVQPICNTNKSNICLFVCLFVG